GVVGKSSYSHARIVNPFESGPARRISVRMSVETECVITLDVGLRSWIIHVADDRAVVIDPIGKADSRKGCAREARRVKCADGTCIGKQTMKGPVCIPLIPDQLSIVVDTTPEGRGRAREIEGGETVGTYPCSRALERFREGLAVKLLDHPKATELTLHA